MAVWSKLTTNALGKRSLEILEKEIEIEGAIQIHEEINENIVDEPETLRNWLATDYTGVKDDGISEGSISHTNEIEIERINCLISMMKIDRKVDEREIGHIETILSNMDFAETELKAFRDSYHNSETHQLDFELFNNSDELSIGLIADLIAISKIDEELHPTEKMYLKKIAKGLNIDDEDLQELLSY